MYDVILQGRLIIKGLEEAARTYIIKVGAGATTYIDTNKETEKGKAFTVTIPNPKGKLSRLYARYHEGKEKVPFTSPRQGMFAKRVPVKEKVRLLV